MQGLVCGAARMAHIALSTRLGASVRKEQAEGKCGNYQTFLKSFLKLSIMRGYAMRGPKGRVSSRYLHTAQPSLAPVRRTHVASFTAI